jgi:hypothetical protein
MSAGISSIVLGAVGGMVLGSALSPDTPDTSGMNSAAVSNSAIAGRQEDLAEKQYADAMAIYKQYEPMYQEQVKATVDAQKAAMLHSDQQWSDYMSTFQPVEQKLAQKSLDYSDPGRIEQAAAQAGSTAADQVDRAQTENEAALRASGASEEKIASLGAAGRLVGAKTIAGAEGQGRSDAESKAMAYLDNTARFGRNMPSTGIATAAQASADSAQALQGAQQQQAAISAPATNANSLLSSAVSSNASSASILGASANLQMQGDMNSYNAIMGGIGGGAKLGAMLSTETVKDMGPEVDGEKALGAILKSPAKAWSYRPGEGDGSTQPRIGPTAESLADAMPQVSDGKQIDVISLLGLHHAALHALAKQSRKASPKAGKQVPASLGD